MRFRRVGTVSGHAVGDPSPRFPRTVPSLADACEAYPPPLRYGSPLPEDVSRTRNVGKVVRLGPGANAPTGRIVGSTAPVRPTLAQAARRSPSMCERGYLVETDGGVRVAVNARQVRELNRTPREGLCPFHQALDVASLGAVMSEVDAQRKAGTIRHPRDLVSDLPYPHRAGSSPCCEASEVTPEKVLVLLEGWRTGEAGDEMSAGDVVAYARRAVPRSVSAKANRGIASVADIERAMVAVRDHCWSQWTAWAKRQAEARGAKFRRVKAEARAVRAALKDSQKR